MGVCIEKIECPNCSKHNLQTFQQEDDTVDGYCFSCGHVSDDPYGGNPTPKVEAKDPEKLTQELREYVEYPIADLPQRKLKREYLEYFGVRMQVSEEDGVTPMATMFPYGKDGELLGWKVCTLGENKRQWLVGTNKGAQFFGWARAKASGQKTLYITEGEYDAVALFQILKESNKHGDYADVNPAVVSLRSGCKSAKRTIMDQMADIKKYFKEVVLVFDMDEPGQEAAQEVCRVAPLRPEFRVADLPCKDANDCLMQGASKACKNAVVFRADKLKNNRLVKGGSLRELARQESKMGMAWPYVGMTKATRGIRRGETLYFGAGVKMGKSELVNDLAKNVIVDHDLPAFIVKPEEALPKSFKMLCGKAVGRIFHDPSVEFDYDAFDRAADMIGDKAIFEDIYQFADWDNLKDDIRYAAVADGVKDVFLDPITCFTNQMDTGTANEFLTGMAAELSAMALDLDFTAYIFCHLKAPQAGPPHEMGGKVLSTQFAGSRAMMRSCNYMIGMSGNKDPELPMEQRNTRHLTILEDREFGVSATVDLYWDYKTGLFTEIHG